MSDVPPTPRLHAFSHAPAALRIFRFAADSAPRVLELAHVSAFLRECAVEFGSADAALPGAMRNEYASGRYFKLRSVVERNARRCPWYSVRALSCRDVAPMPAAALAPDVTRHDVDWGAEGVVLHPSLTVLLGGFGLQRGPTALFAVAVGAEPVSSGKHVFSVTLAAVGGSLHIGWSNGCLRPNGWDHIGAHDAPSHSAGATYSTNGGQFYTSAPNGIQTAVEVPRHGALCTVAVLLDLDANPGRMTVFVDGEALPEQSDFRFEPSAGPWRPTVALLSVGDAVFSNALQ
jgi:hypothetical protein